MSQKTKLQLLNEMKLNFLDSHYCKVFLRQYYKDLGINGYTIEFEPDNFDIKLQANNSCCAIYIDIEPTINDRCFEKLRELKGKRDSMYVGCQHPLRIVLMTRDYKCIDIPLHRMQEIFFKERIRVRFC